GERGGFAAADAEAGDAAFQVARFERVQKRDDDARARSADRMAERAGAAMDVDLVRRQVEVADRGERDDGERLVDLVEIDLVVTPADLGQELLDRADGCGGE